MKWIKLKWKKLLISIGIFLVISITSLGLLSARDNPPQSITWHNTNLSWAVMTGMIATIIEWHFVLTQSKPKDGK